MNRRTLLAIAAALAAAGTTYAAENPRQVYQAMMPQSRTEALAKVKLMFDRVDSNHDGTITRAEFDAFRAARLAEWQAGREQRRDKVFAAMDRDGNGQISKAEFEAFAASPQARAFHRVTQIGMRGGDWFDRVDANHDGKLSYEEAESAAMARFDAADTNHDGTLTPVERRAAWLRAAQKLPN